MVNRNQSVTLLLVASVAACVFAVNRSGASTPQGRYLVDETAGTVLDRETGLEWEREPGDEAFTQSGAQSHCSALTLDGAGWHLPAIEELETLVDDTRSAPAIDTLAFPGTYNEIYWAKDVVLFATNQGMYVDFSDGSRAANASVTFPRRARCVRPGG